MRLSSRHFCLWLTTTTTTSSLAFSRSSRRSLTTAFVRHQGNNSSNSLSSSLSTRSRSPPSFTRRFMSSNNSFDNDDDDEVAPVRLRDELKVALLQMPVTADKEWNHETAATTIRQAASEGAELVVLPEIWNGPYAVDAFCEYAEVLPNVGEEVTFSSPSAELLQQLAVALQIWIVGGSVPEVEGSQYYNTCLVFDPTGKLVAKHRKVHLFDIDVPDKITFFESDTLTAGRQATFFDSPFGKIGVGICYDLRFAEYSLLLRDCSILIFPGAFNMTTGPAHWELLQRARALDNQCFCLTASPSRTEAPATGTSRWPHYTAWGHSSVVDPWGVVIATTEADPDVVHATLDLTKVDQVRQAIPIRKQRRTDLYELLDVQAAYGGGSSGSGALKRSPKLTNSSSSTRSMSTMAVPPPPPEAFPSTKMRPPGVGKLEDFNDTGFRPLN